LIEDTLFGRNFSENVFFESEKVPKAISCVSPKMFDITKKNNKPFEIAPILATKRMRCYQALESSSMEYQHRRIGNLMNKSVKTIFSLNFPPRKLWKEYIDYSREFKYFFTEIGIFVVSQR